MIFFHPFFILLNSSFLLIKIFPRRKSHNEKTDWVLCYLTNFFFMWQGLSVKCRQMQRFFKSSLRMMMKELQYQQLHHQQSTFSINIYSCYKSPLPSYVSFTFNKLCFTKWRMINASTKIVALNELQKVLHLENYYFSR